MNKVTKKMWAAMLSLVMILSVVTVSPAKAQTNDAESVITTETVENGASEESTPEAAVETTAEEAVTETQAQTTAAAVIGTVTVTVEKFTIGQGYLVQPTKITIRQGDTAATVFETVMKLNRYTYNGGISEYGFYVDSINNADSLKVDIPKEISSMPATKFGSAPSNQKNDGNKLANKALGTGSYCGMAGWMFTVNNQFPSVAADQVKLKNGDLVRWQFSLYGYGADLGQDTSSYTSIPKITLASKDALMKELAAVNAKYYDYYRMTGFMTVYNQVVKVSSKYNATQAEVNDALNKLKKAEKGQIETTTKAKTPVTTTVVTVKRAEIKKIKNVKRYKAKISVKKLPKISGYEYKYADNKKFKKAKTKTTKKSTIITKKLDKKQRCYAKVRAYVKVKKKKVYGTWSKMKSVKIKK